MALDSRILHDFAALRPARGFRVVLADPPWEFRNWSAKGEKKSAKRHYPTMSTDDICALPVLTLAADDCALFLWTTWPLMPEWTRVIESWGFTFAGLAWEWIKYNESTRKYAFGGGYGTRKNLEPCLLATRGNPRLRKNAPRDMIGGAKVPDGVHSVRDFIIQMPGDCIRDRLREHSRKPEDQYRRIETMFDGPYVELFARNKRRGWSSWGNETEKFEAVGE